MKKILSIYVFSLTLVVSLLGQRTVTGEVRDATTGGGLVGASVLLKGTSTGTTTDINASYSIDIPNESGTLIFSYTGYQEQEVTIGSNAVINVTLLPSRVIGEEVILFSIRDRCGVENRQYIDKEANTSLRVNSSRDPNYILVNKAFIPPGSQSEQLDYEVHFQNLGNGPASTVRVQFFGEQVLNRSSLSRQKYHLNIGDELRQHIEFTKPNTATTNATLPINSLTWRLVGTSPRTRYILAPLDLNLSTEEQYATKGHISFSIKTNGQLQEGDSIMAYALIYMDDRPVYTDTTYTVVRKPRRISLPWQKGIIGGINEQEVTSITGEHGFFAGITFRKSGKLSQEASQRYAQSPFIPVSALPEWWYQAEITYTQLKILNDIASTPGSQLTYRSIDIVPLEIRYVPERLHRLVGLSAGIFGSYYLNTQLNGAEFNIADLEDRLSYGWFVDLRLLSNLGTPGLSIGYRLNNYEQSPFTPTQWTGQGIDRYSQLYLHLNIR